MRRGIFKKSPLASFLSALAPVLFTCAIILVIVYSLNQAERSSKAEGLRLLEEGLRRAAVTCYVTDGLYPDSVSYIEEHYGVRVDRTKYVVHYEVFASNIMPDISVHELS